MPRRLRQMDTALCVQDGDGPFLDNANTADMEIRSSRMAAACH